LGRLALNKGISRVSIQTTSRETQYAREGTLLESLEVLRTRYDVPLKQALLLIASGKTDKVSLGKEKPYFRFYANLIRNTVYISIQEPARDLSFQIPLSALSSIL
jgi:hypothetical protein